MGHGVDSEASGWVTDYMLCGILVSFSVSLYRRGVSKYAVRTQVFMSGGYLFGALGHHVFPYRAYTDYCGLRAFYVVWMLAYGSQCASCISWCMWCDNVLRWHLTRKPMVVLCTLTTVLGLMIAGGCVACIAVVDPPGSKACNGSGPPACDTLVMNAEGLFYLLWGWAWALVGTRIFLLLRSARIDAPPPSYGSEKSELHFFWFNVSVRESTRFALLHIANATAPLALLTYGPFLILYVFFFSVSRGLDVTDVYSRNNIGIIYHTGVLTTHLMTFYLALNVPPVHVAWTPGKASKAPTPTRVRAKSPAAVSRGRSPSRRSKRAE